MYRLRIGAALLGAAALWTPAVSAQQTPHAFVGARALPITSAPIDDSAIVVYRGEIVAIGPADEVSVPSDAIVHDVTGFVIMPGLVDTHSHVGGGWGGDSSAPTHPDARILDSINARDPSIQKAQAGGVTTANVMPGSGHLLSGQTLYLKFRDGRTIDDLLMYVDGSDGVRRVAGGIKMANGTNSRDEPPFPGTRAKSAAIVRSMFVEAQAYREKLARAGDDVEKRPDRDLALEALVEVLDGHRVVHHHTHRHDDIVTVLRLAEEFGFDVVLQHVSEGYKVAEEIAAAGAPCSVIVIDAPGGKLEAVDMSLGNARALHEAGALVALHTDDPVNDSRYFTRSAGLAVRAGLDRDAALAALTIAGAEMLDLADRVGSLEVGKDADLVLLDGDPLSVYTKVLQTWVEGERVFDRDDARDRLWAEGGWGASRPGSALHMCCAGHDAEMR